MAASMESGSGRWGAREALYGGGHGEQDSQAMGAGSPIAVSMLLEIRTEPWQPPARPFGWRFDEKGAVGCDFVDADFFFTFYSVCVYDLVLDCFTSVMDINMCKGKWIEMRYAFSTLIDLIEGSVYTSVDYLYYKRKDSLVVIQKDSDVMEMLNESGRGGTKKKKGLNVMHTEALYANEVEQHDDENQNTSGDGDEVPGKRKGTVLTHVWDLLGRDRIVTLSEKNKISCEMKKTTHTTGTKSYARWFEDMVELENLLDTQPELAQNSEGGVAFEGDALHRVLGEEKAGQMHDMGLLPVPKQVYGRRTHHFKDINIASLDGSSSDVETHMLEEIRQLKEHSRMQDKVIEELKNNQRHHENQEAIVGNFARSDHNNSQNQAVLSKRKRVHYVAPNQNDGFLEHRDELNKETCESEYSDDDSLLLSTTSKTTKKQKGHHGGSGETMTIAHQEVAHDKVTCNKRQAPKQLPVMKPNKANVAYATLLSTDPEAIVGVKTRSQFYKVRIDHAIAKDEPLVRPRPGCNNIGDAQAKGVSIAWPLMFVQMING
ncbi:unnamed protein product [Miscanthus lutarioriparius]|uniref:Transposase Tnp1/En/Spm-like domain-containing protein n=1 Tax=Miscanthus lutarioriparius TaxID=422564 RepID=A0A811MI90_9POAL|nr:unnamed protein product [Miscanthus lutarioriparius]